ncbi:hypothetical protein [Methylobacterium flocculans]|uniref:hypothetical protein n=1 Tax=Methylobacterium flocculans TaxID=2984843 RepID=UPI0021F323CA|nr:hypothetical protein [Methylobacterium sp. FF17]
MRAVLFALVGLSVGTSAAYAKPCRLDGMELAAQSRAEKFDPALVDARFKVIAQSSAFHTAFNPGKGREATWGKITVRLKGQGGSFVVQQDYDPNSMPWVSGESWFVGDAKAAPISASRNRTKEKALFTSDGAFDIYSGPLSGLTLTPINCR